ncbi:hypothetical protein BDF20DRAFT_544692 [Mycotypha africana]|uniref:uncharacterized protein n=1 Tax=Mycotypha africana TaxID=64632 RepID=UPI0022FFD93B|nr:uncharacterized protein BDF20DRAFT_544692 [Mycotypha africana]KAI8977106.1 hypothetical protein BDF20DRAFT_544692 [Mycotypha africana]
MFIAFYTPVYASPTLPQSMASATPYYNGPSPYTPTIVQPTPSYPYSSMGAMQVNGQPPIIVQQQPYPVYQQRSCCDCCDCCDCCYNDCACLTALLASICLCCFCCGNESDECCC